MVFECVILIVVDFDGECEVVFFSFNCVVWLDFGIMKVELVEYV